ncbi:SusD-like starch-binding protein associating with outer membrane [Tenacibaculum adriaticum]|uniref:SusD-like starch-binding protein associating with outer membrane n=1 Tax=Tenacibaculum adriaticum TaxID=413713 RepID=A0A5S5DNV3_9FLAO|nr:SusD/RagB family nutrient-binding outer membrane lipoprotein [Tenacibaculum adriaticum]TYP97405.1 SusD-like starch-binding protein associating with outer membrane [Tenacibaculum adriaticum]
MRKIIYIIILTLAFGACDQGFEELNVDSTKPIQVGPETKLAAIQLYTSGERYENWRANLIYSSTMMQHFSTTAGYWAGDKYTWNKGYASSMIDRIYGNAVKNIEDLLVQLDTEDAPAEMKAITRIQRVLIYHRLTDLYGDVPYSEAGKAYLEGIVQPKYDAQSDIYADMLKELEEAAADLGNGTSGFGDGDLIYHGDQAKWKRFANSMMLRLGLRLIKIDATASQEWVTKAISGGVMESNEDIMYIQHTPGPEGINKNGNGEVFSADNSMHMSKTFVDFLQDDPRLPILAMRRSDESTNPNDLIGFPNGLDLNMLQNTTGESNTDNYAGINRNTGITSEAAPMFFQTYAEVEFMLAEAAERWGLAGGNPEPHYNAGVRAAMKTLALYGPDAVISDTEIDTYLSVKPFDSANALEQINTQYWAATFLNEYEAFANWRRTGFPVLIPVNYPGNVTNGTIPRRLTYAVSEQSVNAANYAAAIAVQGPDELTTRVWWDKP